MSGIFKKAMNLFVEFEEDTENSAKPTSPSPAVSRKIEAPTQSLNPDEFDKFEKHFEKIFDQANFPGPDYYEFWKMSETLEVHIKDEKARLSATYASLAIQGLTKEKLVETATKYKELIDLDKLTFEKAIHDKAEKEIGVKRKDLQQLEQVVAKNAEMIQKLTKEISDAQVSMSGLKKTITEEESKLARNKQGYALACEAMTRKISDDITKIQTTL